MIGLQNRIKELECREPLSHRPHDLNANESAASRRRDGEPPFQYFFDEDDPESSPSQGFGVPTPRGKALELDTDLDAAKNTNAINQPLINPLVASKSQLLFGDHGYFRYLGHSSTWAFSRQLRNLLNNSGAGSPLHEKIPKGDGVFYDVTWNQKSVDLSSVQLPCLDLAEYYTNTVTFSFGSLYHCYDHEAFMDNLREFYADRETGCQKPASLWQIQMLLVFACGKSILAREATKTGQTGMNFFAPAIEALPDIRALQNEPILAIEVLCLVSLFLEASDIRSGSWGYVCAGLDSQCLQADF